MSDDEERSQFMDAPIEIELEDTTPQTEPDVTPQTPVSPEEPVKPRTPLPKGAILAACLVFSCEAFQYTFVFPFLAFMYATIHVLTFRIIDFGLVEHEEDAGYYAGILAGCYAIAQFISSFFFGAIADKYSKRSVIIVSCIGCLITMLSFGFSVNFGMALAMRTLCGLFNGNMATTRAYMNDITDASNQALGFSFLGFGWGVGSVLGPTFGGLLSRPATTYAIFKDNAFLMKFPYVLPCLVCSVIMIVGLISCILFMKPYHHEKHETKADDQLQEMIEQEEQTPPTYWKKSITYLRETWQVLHNNEVLTCTFMYFLVSCSDTMQEELFPLWSIIRIEIGGIAFNNVQLGILNAVMGGLCVLEPFFYPYIAKRLGHLNSFRIGFVCNLVLIFTPQLHYLKLYGGDVVMWVGLVIWCFARVLVQLMIFLTAILLVNNSAPRGRSGIINGFSGSVGCVARTVATLSAGPLLSACAWNIYLLNVPFIIACGVIPVIGIAASLRLNSSINEPKK
jgi:MFS family permease